MSKSGHEAPSPLFTSAFDIRSSLHKLAIAAMPAIVLFLCAGCGGSHEASVSGIVYLDDKPLQTSSSRAGSVTFYPSQGGAAVYGQIAADGAYKLSTGSEEGLKPGEYKVTVMVTDNPPAAAPGQAPPVGTPVTPAKYSRKETTDLVFTVEPGDNKIDLRLTGP